MNGSQEPILSPSLLEELGELAGKELARRLKNPKLREEIPGTGLLNLALAAAKQAEARQKPEKDEVEETDVLEIIKNSSMPKEQKIELLKKERDKAYARYQEIEKTSLEGL